MSAPLFVLSSFRLATLLLALLAAVSAGADALRGEPDTGEFRRWIEQMKQAPRGPFERVRWFCADGSVLPPQEGACRERGGGVQHGEWNAQTRLMRQQGYLVANLLADIRPGDYVGDAGRLDELRQILLEQFLVATDDGWVFRRARFHRGALQAEDEQIGASRLLMALVDDPAWRDPSRFLLLREAVRLLPVSSEPKLGSQVRQLAVEIAGADPAFAPLRVKIHGIPDAKDAQMVRSYAQREGRPELADKYERLAGMLDALNAPQTAVRRLASLAADTRSADLRRLMQDAASRLEATADLAQRAQLAASLLAEWRRRIESDDGMAPLNRLRMLIASLAMEQEAYAVANQLADQGPGETRASRLTRLRTMGQALYGSGLLSARQSLALEEGITGLTQRDVVGVVDYASALRYLARVPQWAQQSLEFHFGTTVQRWTALTPMAAHFVPDRLRGSPLLAYTRLLDSLVQDANRLAGVSHRLLGQKVGGGLRALNPGLRRGVLLLPPDDGEFRRDGIYLLPSTTPDLPPIAGILTRGEGSSLSHVQLLARNLGIPNVVVDEERVAQLMPHLGEAVVLAVSPRGAVEISADGPQWEPIFGREGVAGELVIEPDLARLDLKSRALLPLREIRAADSGRTVGPKAANLGELRHNYPDAVNPGVAIPFGVFRALLDQPLAAGGPAVFDWMKAEYARIGRIGDDSTRDREVRQLLERLREWVASAEPGEAFRYELRARMTEVFGDADSVGVFVRSDTNVEDLPGFTGAGLNLTVPNVVGFDAVVDAIRRVWASPFSERAYVWRQSHMTHPEHVYPAVLLLQTFSAEKSGVLVTTDVESGDREWLTIAAGEGVGAAVEGQAVEQVLVRRSDGKVRLLSQASAPLRAEPDPAGGIHKVPASGRETVLTPAEIEQLRRLADDVERRFPMPPAADGLPAPADIEFGFAAGRLALFQIRPFVESVRARRSEYLISMDRRQEGDHPAKVDLGGRPGLP